jgi:hypothetical protein
MKCLKPGVGKFDKKEIRRLLPKENLAKEYLKILRKKKCNTEIT